MASDSASVSHNLKEPSSSELDSELERQIETAHRIGMRYATSDPELSRGAFRILGLLISKRSAEQIERLERAKGLR